MRKDGEHVLLGVQAQLEDQLDSSVIAKLWDNCKR
jgi:hypothetical protein